MRLRSFWTIYKQMLSLSNYGVFKVPRLLPLWRDASFHQLPRVSRATEGRRERAGVRVLTAKSHLLLGPWAQVHRIYSLILFTGPWGPRGGVSFLDAISPTLQKAVPGWAPLSQMSWSQVKATSWWTPRKFPQWWIQARCAHSGGIQVDKADDKEIPGDSCWGISRVPST